MPAPNPSLIPVGALQYLGGAIVVYAHAECVAVATLDQVSLSEARQRPPSLADWILTMRRLDAYTLDHVCDLLARGASPATIRALATGYRPSGLERLPTAEALVAYAAHVARAQPQLCVLLCQAWHAHERLAVEACTIDTTAVVLDGEPS